MFGAVSDSLQIFLKYSRYVSVLKWLTLSLFAYFGTMLVVHVPWDEVAHGLFIPKFTTNAGFWTSVVGMLGTIISPFFSFGRRRRKSKTRKPSAIVRIRLDTHIGMALFNLVAWRSSLGDAACQRM
ncbi:divalent metal cation transporter [Mesorhizobium sp.]|uniref:divalent metal cation transporter n=1 Tax=Mesorhizobium sp. TaxID=1871066 RepID=UPI00121D0BA2|nr:divalent metal cation transporter [Mesorhizobium sp.]TIX21857.1 MAG: divalent metal cation transporter [Mesorhizobium sp.]